MLSFLFHSIRIFGLFRGIAIYCRIKILRSESFYLPGLPKPVYYRPGTVDISTFREIFLREEYAINFPATKEPEIIIDAGANIGFTSLFLLKRYPSAKIFSLEPDSGNFEILKRNTRGYPSITTIQKAVWNKPGLVEIVDKGYGLRGFTVEDSGNSVFSLSATTLEDLMKDYNLPHIDILKMDIEGSEKEVFEADTRWLGVTHCLIIELHDRMKPGCSKAVFRALNSYNFDFSIKGENLVFVNRDFNRQLFL